MMTDPIGDLLTRIRNAGMARHAQTSCPSSKMKLAVAQVLTERGYLGGVHVEAREGHPVLVVDIRYNTEGLPIIDGIRRASRPGRRVYVGADEIPKVRNGLGSSVISTSKGVMSDDSARDAHVGGEVVCEVW
jgi:small subunit ribosomal protein S8